MTQSQGAAGPVTRMDIGQATYFSDVACLPRGCRVAIYGCGKRGKLLAGLLQRGRPDIAIQAFIDSYRSGSLEGRQVVLFSKADALNGILKTGGLIVIASTFFKDIQAALAPLGLGRVFVFIEHFPDPTLSAQIAAFPRVGLVLSTPEKYPDHEIEAYVQAFGLVQARANIRQVLFPEQARPQTFLGLPCAGLDQARDLDALLPLSAWPDELFSLILDSPLRGLPVLTASPARYRTLFREALWSLRGQGRPLRCLELGCLEHLSGGDLSTRHLAQALAPGETLVSVSQDPDNLLYARLHCRDLAPGPRLLLADALGEAPKILAALGGPADLLSLRGVRDSRRNSERLARLLEAQAGSLAERHLLAFERLGESGDGDTPFCARLRERGYRLWACPLNTQVTFLLAGRGLDQVPCRLPGLLRPL